MKNIPLLLIICFSWFIKSEINSQKKYAGIVYYESKINKKQLTEYLNKGRNNLKNERVKGTLDNIYQNTSIIKSSLTFINNTGTFKVDEQLNLDTKELAQTVLKTVSGGSNEYYYNTTDHIFLIKNCETLGECFIFDNTYLEWILTQETKIINNFLCYKAT